VSHVLRLEDERAPEKAIKVNIEGKRPVRRPRGRGLDAAVRDAKSMSKCNNWRRLAEDRDAWRRRIEEDKAQIRL
jgi:hypothetical protein